LFRKGLHGSIVVQPPCFMVTIATSGLMGLLVSKP